MVSYNPSDCLDGLYSSFPLVDVSCFVGRCRDFAVSCSNNYGLRNQSSLCRIEDQVCFGKLGEFVAYKSLCGFVNDLSEPDLSVFGVNEKSFEWDLFGGGCNFAVKSFDVQSSNPVSWTFQYSDMGGFGRDDVIFDTVHTTHDYVVFVVLGSTLNKGRICSVVPLQVIDNMTGYDFVSSHGWDIFERPKKADLIGIKKCIYWRRLIDLCLVPSLYKGSDKICRGA